MLINKSCSLLVVFWLFENISYVFVLAFCSHTYAKNILHSIFLAYIRKFVLTRENYVHGLKNCTKYQNLHSKSQRLNSFIFKVPVLVTKISLEVNLTTVSLWPIQLILVSDPFSGLLFRFSKSSIYCLGSKSSVIRPPFRKKTKPNVYNI